MQTLPHEINPTHPPGRPGWMVALITFVLIVAGIVMWLHFGSIEWIQGNQLKAFLAIVVFSLLLGGSVVIERLLRGPSFGADAGATKVLAGVAFAVDRTRHFPPLLRWATSGLLALVAAGFILALNLSEEPDLYPAVCDEYSYLVQAQQIAHGQFWAREHACPDFFTTFQLVATPVYASIYFSGTALWLAPWSMIDPMGGAAWIAPLLASALAVALAYLVVSELLDDLAGVVVALLILTTPVWRGMSMLLMGQTIVAMLGLLTIFLFLRWQTAGLAGRSRAALALASAAGFVATWAMLCRPVDGLAYAGPVLIAVLLVPGVARRLRIASIVAALIGVVPFASLQLAINRAFTGSALQTPFSWYNGIYLPGTNYGLSARPDELLPPHATAHFRLSYENFTRDFVEQVNRLSIGELAYDRLATMAYNAVAHGFMLAWMPLALLMLLPVLGRLDPVSRGARRAPRWLLALPFALMWLLYLPYGFFLNQYATAGVPSMVFCLVAGAYGLAAVALRTVPALETAPRRATWLILLIFSLGSLGALSTRGLPFLANLLGEDWYRIPELRHTDEDLAAIEGRALVFITPPDTGTPEAEAVYNLGVAFPDDARVVRAHDLARRNVELINYYAQVQPDRRIHHYERGTRRLTDLGTARELAAQPAPQIQERFEQLSRPWRRAYAHALIETGYYDRHNLPFALPPDDETKSTDDD